MLALIACRGALPAAIARLQSKRPFIATLEGQEPDDLRPDLVFQLEKLGTALHHMRRIGITQIVLCGRVERVKFQFWALDWRTMRLLPNILRALRGGEDSALRIVVEMIERSGFEVLGAHHIAAALLPEKGIMGRHRPPQLKPELEPKLESELDLSKAQKVLADQSARDMGQACVIDSGKVIAQEDHRGTDAMLAELAGRTDLRRAFLFKAPKINQDLRVDMPTIGLKTAQGAVAAGLGGIVIAAQGVLVLDRIALINKLDEEGLYLWVR